MQIQKVIQKNVILNFFASRLSMSQWGMQFWAVNKLYRFFPFKSKSPILYSDRDEDVRAKDFRKQFAHDLKFANETHSSLTRKYISKDLY